MRSQLLGIAVGHRSRYSDRGFVEVRADGGLEGRNQLGRIPRLTAGGRRCTASHTTALLFGEEGSRAGHRRPDRG